MILFEKISRVDEPRIPAQAVTVKADGVLLSLPEALNCLRDRTLGAITAANGNIEAAEACLEQLLAELDWHEGD